MSTRNPITTVGRSSESLFTNVESGKGRFLFKEKPEIKNICGLFGTAGKPRGWRNPKIEKSDFKEVFIKYYGVNLQASSGEEKMLFTNIRDSSISPSTTGHYMSPNTNNERRGLRSIDYDGTGNVKELFQQLIRDIDQKNANNANFTGDFRNTIKILGGEGVDMTKEDVFGILFVHDGGSEGKKVTGNGIIYHIYRHVYRLKNSVLKKVESYFQVAGNILTIESDAATLPVVQGLAKLIDVNGLEIEKGPIMMKANRQQKRGSVSGPQQSISDSYSQGFTVGTEEAEALLKELREEVMDQAKETENELQKLQAIQKSSGGGRRVSDAIKEVEAVIKNVEENGIEEDDASTVVEVLYNISNTVSSIDDETINSQELTIGTEEMNKILGWVEQLREWNNNIDSAVPRESGMSDVTSSSYEGYRDRDRTMSGLPQDSSMPSSEYPEPRDGQPSMSSGLRTPISSENDSLKTRSSSASSSSYKTAKDSPMPPRGGKRKTRRRSSKKNRKSKKVGGKKTKPKGKKIPFKKLLKKTRAKK